MKYPPSEMQDADPGGMRNRIGAAHGVQLLQQRSNMIFRRVRRDAEPAADQFVRRALGEQRQHFQLPGGERDAAIMPRYCGGRGKHDGVGLVVLADQLDPINVREDRRDPVRESGISPVNRQPYPIARTRFAQAAGLSPICSLVWCTWPPLRNSISASLPTLSGPSDRNSGRSLLSGLPSKLTSTSPW